MTSGRRTDRTDREDRGIARPKGAFVHEGGERRFRKNADSDRWESKDREQSEEMSYERGIRERESGRFSRRDGPARGHWFRDNDAQDPDNDEYKTPVRHREWRRGVTNTDREWNKHTKHDQDPEWMDPTRAASTTETHTQEDFERWKEKMKAGASSQNQSSQSQQAEIRKEASNPLVSEPKFAEPKRSEGELFKTMDSTFAPDPGLDNFFSKWNGPKPREIRGEVSEQPKEVKPVRSRFAGLFSSPPGQPSVPAVPPASTNQSSEPTRPVSTDADQEGFQRILQMLGSNKPRIPTPHASSQSRSSVSHTPAQSGFTTVPQSIASPPADRQQFDILAGDMPSGHPSGLGDPSQRAKHEIDFLVQLMNRHSTSSGLPSQANSQAPVHPPGLMNISNASNLSDKAPASIKQKSPVYLDDPAISSIQPRRDVSGSKPFFDETGFPGHTQNILPLNNLARLRHQAQPMGIPRPPGLEQAQSTGWVGQQSTPQLLFPPGLSQPTGRSMYPNFPSGPPLSVQSSIPPERQFQRNPSLSGFAPSPCMFPPAGYMGINVPPPSSFPHLPHGGDTMMGLSHGNSTLPHYPSMIPQGPPVSAARLLDVFGQPAGGDGRGGAGITGPGPYR